MLVVVVCWWWLCVGGCMSVVVVVVCWFVSPFFSAIGLGWSKKHIFFFF